jgi:hypothetical protein
MTEIKEYIRIVTGLMATSPTRAYLASLGFAMHTPNPAKEDFRSARKVRRNSAVKVKKRDGNILV